MNDNSGNKYYSYGLILLCKGLGKIPPKWEEVLDPYFKATPEELRKLSSKKLEDFYVKGGDILEAMGALANYKIPYARHFCLTQRIPVEDAQDLLHLLSCWIGKVMRLSSYYSQTASECDVLSCWMKESTSRLLKSI